MYNLFPLITLEEIHQLFPKAAEIAYPSDTLLFREGEKPEYLYILLRGRLQLFKYDNKANEITLHYFEPVSLIAELAILQEFTYPASARFIADGTVLKISVGEFCSVLQKNVRANHLLLQSLIQKLQILNMTISRTLTMDAVQRVAHFLYHMPNSCPNLKHHQIASMLSLRPETFSRVLRQFKDEGILDSESGHIHLQQRELLKKYL